MVHHFLLEMGFSLGCQGHILSSDVPPAPIPPFSQPFSDIPILECPWATSETYTHSLRVDIQPYHLKTSSMLKYSLLFLHVDFFYKLPSFVTICGMMFLTRCILISNETCTTWTMDSPSPTPIPSTSLPQPHKWRLLSYRYRDNLGIAFVPSTPSPTFIHH